MGLYVHVPFCATKCPYCDFNTYQGIEVLFQPYLEALTTELSLWGRVLGAPRINTIFLGGGTPSYLPSGYIQRILETIHSSFRVADHAETTVEANPDDLDPARCGSLISEGANRLSIGVQSLDDGLLKVLGRRHNAAQAVQAVKTARAAGLANISLDLMYGLPNQSVAQWRDTVERVVDLVPDHLSFYCLTPEEGTPLYQWLQEGSLDPLDSDLAADMYQWARETLAQAGFRHYEISNWSKPGRSALHNEGYWRNLPYLGVGPGAHSHLGDFRFWDVSSPKTYIDKVKSWEAAQPPVFSSLSKQGLKTAGPVGDWEHINTQLSCSETMILGLRLLEGMDLEAASRELGVDLESLYRDPINELIDLGLLERAGRLLRLTEGAYLIANQVFTRFVE